MRKVESSRKRPAGGIKWDEQNLQDNEVIKATINKTKINEPKTPYHGPLGDQHMEDVDEGLQPLELDSHPQQHLESLGAGSEDGDAAGSGSAINPSPDDAEVSASTDSKQAVAVDADGQTAPIALGPSGPVDHKHGHGHGHHAHFESSLLSGDVFGEPESRSGFSSDSERRASLTGGSDAESNGEDARRKFEQRRRAHYNMRAALRRARMLLSEDGEDGEKSGDTDGEDGVGRQLTPTSGVAEDIAVDEGLGKQSGDARAS